MMQRIKQLFLGSPLPSQELEHSRLNKVRALAAFSPDALSSIAYANQEIYLGLLLAGSAGLVYGLPIAIVIICILMIVAFSYYQTIRAYPSGGGSYIVARENLGDWAGMTVAGALLLDYLLTAAVSLTAGVEALASAFPMLWAYRIHLVLVILLVITLLNLRGVRETGSFMAVPVYFFILIYLGLFIYGAILVLRGEGESYTFTAPVAVQPLTVLLILRAFASGSTALTGIEAISDSVQAFKPPEAKNAVKTLVFMTILMAVLFGGSIWLTQHFAIIAGPEETILSALARRLFGHSLFYYLVQFSTLFVLAVAANTSFAGFPRVAAFLANDKYLPHQFKNLGDRLVYANGTVMLSCATAAIVILFGGDSHRLIPLFAVGAFLAFTISQMGMVAHWWKIRGKGWQWKGVLNGIGALATGLTFIVVGISKFILGAWISFLIIPLMVTLFIKVRAHYRDVAKQLSLRGLPPDIRPLPRPRLVIPLSGIHRGIFDAINYARSISDDITAVFVEIEPGSGKVISDEWQHWWPDIPLAIVPSPYRSLIGPLLDFLDKIDQECNDGKLATLILPEFIPAKAWHSLLHNQAAWLIKNSLLYRRRRMGYQRAIIDVPYHLRK